MRLSFFNDIFRETWMIEPQTAAAQRQVLNGVLMGLQFVPEDETAQAKITHKQSKAVPPGREINVVQLEGTMLRDDGPCGMVGTRTLASMLREADGNVNVLGHILYIDSGGGASNSVPDLAEAILDCQKPVVAFVDGYMCSAAMYAGSYCNHIIANREDNRVGCIGTLIQLDDYPRQVKDDHNMIHLRVYADGADEKNSEFEEALEGNFKLIKERVLNPANEKFKADIRKNRPAATEDQLKGRTYFAKEVVGSLIDAIGDFDSAVAKVIELSNTNIKQMELKNLQKITSCKDLVVVDGNATLTEEQLGDIDQALDNGTDLESVKTQLTEANNTIETLNAEKANLQKTNSEQSTTIASLKATIAKMNGTPTPPAQSMHNGDPITEQGDNDNPEQYCEQLKKEIYG